MRLVYNKASALLGWFVAPRCIVCGAHASVKDNLCAPCQAELPRNETSCVRCAAPRGPTPDGICGRCLTRAPFYDRACALYRYAPPIDRLVQGFKYERRLDWGRVLGMALAHHLQASGLSADAIVPVPLHRRRLRERGYNQSLELARPIGARLGIPVLPRAVRRVRPTPAQAGLSRDERRRNVRNVFEVARTDCVTERHVAIVDDVMTSGHTVDALARALKRAGARSVAVWVLARA